MRVVVDECVNLDECVNPRLRLALPGLEVETVAAMGWRSLTNGILPREAVSKGFNVFVTLDQNVRRVKSGPVTLVEVS